MEFYLLKNAQMVSGKCLVETGELEPASLIANDDILSYSSEEHQFRIKNNASARINALKDGTPFAVAVNGQVIYFGIFKPGYSSSSCFDSITMDFAINDRIFMRLGYPGTIQGVTVKDERNHPELMATLEAQGKLD